MPYDTRAYDTRLSASVPPFALVESGPRGLTLAAVDGRARREGLTPGQALADARAAVPGLRTRPAERVADRAALQALAQWCGRYGPRRNCHDPDVSGAAGWGQDGLWIDVAGVAHLFGGETRLLADLAAHLSRFGVTARIGLADTFGAAFAVARHAGVRAGKEPWSIIPPDGTCAALGGLPVDALRLPADCVQLLHRLGLRRIGQLYDLPREALAQRFRAGTRADHAGGGPQSSKREREMVRRAGAVLARLDQALGATPEPLLPLETPPALSVRQAFAEPLISTEGVTASTALLSADLCHRLDAAGQGGLRFTLGLYRADGSASHVGIGLSRPCRETGHLIALLAEKLAGLDAGFGVDVMTLSAIEVATLTPRQTALSVPGMTAVAADTSALVDRLSNRLGPARVQHLVAADSHSPERAQQRRPALTDARAILPARRGEARLRHDARPANPTRVGQCDPDLLAGQVVPARRPPVLLPAPEPILVTAELPEGPPQCFTWRRLVRRVLRAEGPERIEPEWWRSIGRDCHRAAHDDRPRDYYAIEAAGGARYWVYRAGLYGCDDDRPPAWFLHGVFA